MRTEEKTNKLYESTLIIGMIAIACLLLTVGFFTRREALSHRAPPISRLTQVKNSLIKVYTATTFGSGVIISNKVALSARHVCERGVLRVTSHLDADLRVEKVRLDKEGGADLCVIIGDFSSMQPRPLEKPLVLTDSRIGEQVFMAGYPRRSFSMSRAYIYGMELVESPNLDGTVSKMYSDKLDVACFPGQSGGPVFNKNMEVAGIIYAYDNGGTACLSVSTMYIHEFLLKLQVQ